MMIGLSVVENCRWYNSDWLRSLIQELRLPLFRPPPRFHQPRRADYEVLVDGRPQTVDNNLHGTHQLFRIDNAVTTLNTLTAISNAPRLMKVV